MVLDAERSKTHVLNHYEVKCLSFNLPLLAIYTCMYIFSNTHMYYGSKYVSMISMKNACATRAVRVT